MDTQTLPKKIATDIKREIAKAEKNNEIPQIPKSLDDWFYSGKSYYYENLEASWGLSNEKFIWNINSTLESLLDDIEYKLEVDFDLKSSEEIIDQLETEIAQLKLESGDEPGLHLYPETINENIWYLAALVSFGQGGAYPEWIGAFKSIEDVINHLKSQGLYSTEEKHSRDIIESWYKSRYENR